MIRASSLVVLMNPARLKAPTAAEYTALPVQLQVSRLHSERGISLEGAISGHYERPRRCVHRLLAL